MSAAGRRTAAPRHATGQGLVAAARKRKRVRQVVKSLQAAGLRRGKLSEGVGLAMGSSCARSIGDGAGGEDEMDSGDRLAPRQREGL